MGSMEQVLMQAEQLVEGDGLADLEQPSARAPRRRAIRRRGATPKEKTGARKRRGAGADHVPSALTRVREELKESQRTFWPRFGVSQSAGCKYESDEREAPKPVLMLIVGFVTGKLSNELLAELRSGIGEQFEAKEK